VKTLLLIRHAHRNKLEDDNGLSQKGEKQAEQLRKYFKRNPLNTKKVRVFSSPKKRCRETLEPLADLLDCEIEIDLRLDEQGHQEPNGTFLKRIAHFIEDWRNSPSGAWIACSHGDWLPLALDRLLGASISLNKGAFAEIRLDLADPELHKLIQSLDSES
jgi:broad specificity phosphatase PhoE